MPNSVESSSYETLNRGPLMLLLRRQYESPFGIDIVLFFFHSLVRDATLSRVRRLLTDAKTALELVRQDRRNGGEEEVKDQLKGILSEELQDFFRDLFFTEDQFLLVSTKHKLCCNICVVYCSLLMDFVVGRYACLFFLLCIIQIRIVR